MEIWKRRIYVRVLLAASHANGSSRWLKLLKREHAKHHGPDERSSYDRPLGDAEAAAADEDDPLERPDEESAAFASWYLRP